MRHVGLGDRVAPFAPGQMKRPSDMRLLCRRSSIISTPSLAAVRGDLQLNVTAAVNVFEACRRAGPEEWK